MLFNSRLAKWRDQSGVRFTDISCQHLQKEPRDIVQGFLLACIAMFLYMN